VLPTHAAEAISLWVVHAHAHDAFQISPILALHQKNAAARPLSVIRYLVPRGVFASNTSSAAVFRIIDKYQTTLLVDEMDTFIRDNEELRGVINSGHQRNAAFVLRVSGDELARIMHRGWRV
jgi:hypothetical protein